MELIWASLVFSFVIGTSIVGAAWILQTRPRHKTNETITILTQQVCKTNSESQAMLDRASDRLLAFTDEGQEFKRKHLELAALQLQLEEVKERMRSATPTYAPVPEETGGPKFRDGAAVDD